MRLIPDETGRFPQRPYYTNDELDVTAERRITDFLTGKHGKVEFPISTDDLVALIEKEASDLDTYGDLTDEGDGIQGVTWFIRGKRPRVRIAIELWEDRTQHRLRTTLTHELGHVCVHTPLFDSAGLQGVLDIGHDRSDKQKCHRDGVLTAPKTDWMEWQAGYFSCAYLMPASHVRAFLDDHAQRMGTSGVAILGSGRDVAFMQLVGNRFGTSTQAARIRLECLGRIVKSETQISHGLFASV